MLELVDQLPEPFLLIGDFNAHNPLWGSPASCQRGSLVADLINHLNLVCLNTGAPTYLSDTTHTYSHLDLAICTPRLARLFEWYALSDTYSSDHFPCVIHLLNHIPSPCPSRWNISKADWGLYSSLAVFQDQNFPSCTSQVEYLTEVITTAAEYSIPRTSPSPRRVPVPWWTDACRDALRARRRALRIFQRHPTMENCINYKRLRAKCRRVIKESKKACWAHFTSSFNRFTPSSVVWGGLRRLSGTKVHSPISGLTVANEVLVEPVAISNALGRSFADFSSSGH